MLVLPSVQEGTVMHLIRCLRVWENGWSHHTWLSQGSFNQDLLWSLLLE